MVEPDELDHALDELVGALLAGPADAVRATKSLLRGALTHDGPRQRRLERETQVPLIRGMLGPR